MKILHLLIGGEVAGGQVVALELARAARVRGHDVAFVSPTSGALLERARTEGFRALVVPLGGALDARSLVRLASLIRREGPDVVHTHVHFALNVLARTAARLAGARVIAHMHAENVFRPGGIARRVQVALDNATARLCETIVAVSEATRTSLVRQGYPAERIVVVRNGVDASARAVPRRPPGVPETAALLAHVGRLGAMKGQRELIDALARLENEEAVAVVVGEDLEAGGAYRHELERRAAALGVGERVVFLGYSADVRSLLAAAEAFVLPSWTEGLPLTVLEAMAAGKPVVATAVGGVPEAVVDGRTGMLVPPRDVDALAGALNALLADGERARRLGEAGRARIAEEFTLDAMTDRVLALYDR